MFQGLNFCIHADATWGGYLITMLREPAGAGTRAERFLVKDNNDSRNVDLRSLISRTFRSIHVSLA